MDQTSESTFTTSNGSDGIHDPIPKKDPNELGSSPRTKMAPVRYWVSSMFSYWEENWLFPTAVKLSLLSSCWNSWVRNSNTVGIWLPDTSSIQMVNMSLIAKWSVNWLMTWIGGKKFGNWMLLSYLWTNNRHLWTNNRNLWTIRPFSYRTFCLLFRSPFGNQTKSSVSGCFRWPKGR